MYNKLNEGWLLEQVYQRGSTLTELSQKTGVNKNTLTKMNAGERHRWEVWDRVKRWLELHPVIRVSAA